MIVGRFDNRGRPYVKGLVNFPRLKVSVETLFLLDTGADSTCLHPLDAEKAHIPFSELRDIQTYKGVGGSSPYFREAAVLSFEDDPQTRFYTVDLLVAEPHGRNRGLPSLLGRDVINHGYMEYDPSLSRLEFTVRHADYTLGVH